LYKTDSKHDKRHQIMQPTETTENHQHS